MTQQNNLKKEPLDFISSCIERNENRKRFFELLLMFCGVCMDKKIPLVIENPFSVNGYLYNNFIKHPDYIDMDRSRRGDFFVKPTQFFFFNFEPGKAFTFSPTPKDKIKRVDDQPSAKKGICSEEKSMISPTYARLFICDQILGISPGMGYEQQKLFKED